jgi:uncharacterized protein with beta-barrel porin domain
VANSNRISKLRNGAALFALCAVWTIAGAAGAGDFIVTNDADSGPGSLRLALNNANDDPDADTITFSTDLTISPLSALPAVSTSVTFDADGNAVTVDGSAAGITQPFLDVQAPVFIIGVNFIGGTIEGTSAFFAQYEFDASNTLTIGSDVTGGGLFFDKTGAGTATITGSIDLPNTIATVSAGTLELGSTGSFTANSLTVRPGATLSGNVAGGGSFTANEIVIHGRVAPSTTSGTLPFNGPTRFEPGSTLEVDILPGNAGDRLDVAGDVTIEPGAQLVTLLDPDAFAAPSTVTVLTGSSIAGNFDFDGSSFLFVDQTLIQDATSISVLVEPSAAVNLGLSPNQEHILDVVTSATPDATGDLATVQAVLGPSFVGTADQYRDLLDAMGGETLSALATGRQLLGERTARALHRRARDPGWGEVRAVYAADATLPAPVFAGPSGAPLGWRASAPAAAPTGPDVALGSPRSRNRVGAWLDAFGQAGELEGDANPGSADIDSVIFGGTLGVDVWLAEKVVLGLAAGYARVDLDPDGRDVDLTSDTIQGALYGGYTDPRGYLSGYGRYAFSFQDSTRDIQSAQLQRTASASWDAEDFGAGAEAGVTVLSVGDFGLQPIAGVDWLSLSEESYRESGAGSLSLDVDPEDLESTTARFGARIFGKIDLDGTGFLVPEVRGFWQREFGDRDRVLRAQLLGAGTGGALVVRGTEMPRDVVILGLGWSANIGELLQVLLDYDVLLDADRVEHQGNLAVRFRF